MPLSCRTMGYFNANLQRLAATPKMVSPIGPAAHSLAYEPSTKAAAKTNCFNTFLQKHPNMPHRSALQQNMVTLAETIATIRA